MEARSGWLAAALVALPACGSQAGTAVTAGPDRLEVQVVNIDWTVPTSESPPISNATVAIDLGSEQRVAETNADGIAVFDGITLRDVVSLGAYADRYDLGAHTGAAVRQRLEEFGSPYRLFLGPPREPDLVSLSGNVELTGLTLLASTSLPGVVAFEAGTAWKLDVPRGVPFTLFALDYSFIEVDYVARSYTFEVHDALVAKVSPLVESQSYDLDFDAEPQPSRETVTVEHVPLPAHTLMHDTAFMYARVRASSFDLQGFLSVTTRAEIEADLDHAKLTVEWIDAVGFDLVTEYLSHTEHGDYASVSREPGAPDSAHEPELLSPPERDAPQAAGPHAMADAIRWRIDGGPDPDIVLLDVKDADVKDADARWPFAYLLASGGEREAVFPVLHGLPTLASLASGTTVAMFHGCTSQNELSCKRFTDSPRFLVEP